MRRRSRIAVLDNAMRAAIGWSQLAAVRNATVTVGTGSAFAAGTAATPRVYAKSGALVAGTITQGQKQRIGEVMVLLAALGGCSEVATLS